MRFFEYEAREIVKRAGIPVTDFGVAHTRAEAREIAAAHRRPRGHQVPGPHGRADEGGRRAVRRHARRGGREGRARPGPGDQRAPAARRARRHQGRGRAGVLRRRRLGRPAQAAGHHLQPGTGGIDIEQVAEEQPDKVGRRHFSNILPLSEYAAKEVIASTGVTGSALNKLVPIVTRLARLFVENDMTLAEINPLGEARPTARSSRSTRTWTWRTRPAARQQGAARRPRRRRRGDAPGARGDRVRARRRGRRRRQDHRGVAGNVTEFDGDLGLVIGAGGGSLTLFDAVRKYGGKPANYCEIGGNPSVEKACGLAKLVLQQAGRRQDRGDDVDRLQHPRRHRRPRRHQGLPRARLRPGARRSRSSASPARGRRRASRSSSATACATPTARCRCTRRPAWPWKERRHEHPRRRRDHLHRPGHHRPRGRQPHARVPGLRRRREGRRRRHARAAWAARSTACRCSTPSRRRSSTTAGRSTARSSRSRPRSPRTRSSRRSRTASS